MCLCTAFYDRDNSVMFDDTCRRHFLSGRVRTRGALFRYNQTASDSQLILMSIMITDNERLRVFLKNAAGPRAMNAVVLSVFPARGPSWHA